MLATDSTLSHVQTLTPHSLCFDLDYACGLTTDPNTEEEMSCLGKGINSRINMVQLGICNFCFWCGTAKAMIVANLLEDKSELNVRL